MLGILLIDKPLEWTSHDVVNRVRRLLSTKRVGHAGTLDPLASGALVVAVGPATRFLQYLPLEPKVYEFDVRFGIETSTQDLEGEVVAEKPLPADLIGKVKAALPSFMGKIEQLPPMFSAVKKSGKPLYEMARKGLDVERETRRVFIESYEVLGHEGDTVSFRVVCSGGTYVRTLGHDLGQIIGCGSHVTRLRRTAVGRFHVDDAISLDEVDPRHLMSLREALPPLELVTLDQDRVDDIWHGQRVPPDEPPVGKVVGLLDPLGRVIGAAEVQEDGWLQPACVIPQEALSGSL